jgi:hypothetical protein
LDRSSRTAYPETIYEELAVKSNPPASQIGSDSVSEVVRSKLDPDQKLTRKSVESEGEGFTGESSTSEVEDYSVRSTPFVVQGLFPNVASVRTLKIPLFHSLSHM